MRPRHPRLPALALLAAGLLAAGAATGEAPLPTAPQPKLPRGPAPAFFHPVAPPPEAEQAPAQPVPSRESSPLFSAIGAPDKFYDQGNPDLGLLQRSTDSLTTLPKDRLGAPDWMAAINSGQLQPRADLHGTGEMEVLDLDVIMQDTREMPWVKFPHRSHTLWLACVNCHPKPFEAKTGANPISMTEIFRGRFCGMCHDRVAFVTFFSCERCHSVPHPGSQAWW